MANKGARLPVSIPNDLTPRQREVLGLIAEGRTNFDIAQRLGISLEGVKYHVSEILQRLEVDSREEAAEAWKRENAPMRRVSRGIAAMAPLRLAAWLAGSVVIVGLVGIVIFAVVSGIGGEDEDGGIATPTMVADPLSEMVDAVVAAVEDEDPEALLALLDLTELECSGQPTPGRPLCPAGTADGTLVPVFPYASGCTTNYVQNDRALLRHNLDEVIGQPEPWVHYATGLTDGIWHELPIDAVVIFESPGRPELDLQLGVVAAGVRKLARGCGGTPQTDAAAFANFLRPPPTARPGAEPPRLVSCPAELDDEICAFAAAAEGWVRAGDVASLIGGGPFDTPTTRSDLEQLLAGGPGGPWTLRSVACPYVRGEPPEPSCSERFALVFSTFDLDGAGVDQAAMVAISYDRAAGGPEIQAYGLPDLDWQHSLIAWPLTQGDTLPGTMGGLGFRVHPVEVLPPGQPTPTPVPAVEVIDGVTVRELVVGAETTLPDDLLVYIHPVRWASESNPGLIRVYRRGDGSLHRDDLFERAREQLGPLAIVSWAADEDFGTIVAASCGAPICEGVALGAWAGTFQLVRSTDGGGTWEFFGQVSASTFPEAITGEEAIMREWMGRDANDQLIERYFLHPSGEEVVPPAPSTSPRNVAGIGLVWEPAIGSEDFGAQPAFDADENVLAAVSAIPNFQPRVSGRAANGSYMGTWEYVPDRPADPHPRTTYIGIVDESGDAVALFTPGPVAPWIRPALAGSGLLLSNAQLPVPAGSSQLFYVPAVFIDLATGRVHPLPELFDEIDDELQPRVLGAVVGRVARVEKPGDCALVFPEPDDQATPIRCYVDGVLLFDEGESRIVDGVTWVRVTTPDGFEGWTAQDGLARRAG